MWLWLIVIATQYQLMMSIVQSRQYGNASGATWWPKLKLMQVAPSGGQICDSFKKRQLSAKFTTNATTFESETWVISAAKINTNTIQSKRWFKLQTQYPGSIVPLAMFVSSAVHSMQQQLWNLMQSFCATSETFCLENSHCSISQKMFSSI